jgi:hypothetical protein
MMSAETAVRQAHMTASDYATFAVRNLCDVLGIDRRANGWRTQLAPFAPVLAAMITAAAKDYDTAMKGGVIEGCGRTDWSEVVEGIGDKLEGLTDAIGKGNGRAKVNGDGAPG